MLYALYFFSSVVLSFFTVRLTGKVLGYEVTKNRFLFWFCMAAIAGDSLLLTLPAELFYVPVRMVILLVVMLMNSLVYSLLFRKFELKMLYLSLLTFVTNANYTTILQMFISERIYYKIVACYLETAVIILLLVLIRKKKKYGVIITESINLIPRRLYVVILIFLYLMSLYEYISIRTDFVHFARFLIFPVVVTIFYITVRIMQISIAEREHEQISALLSMQLENQVEYYRKINEIYNEFRSFRHDFGNHMICLRSLIADEKNEEALDYLAEMATLSRPTKENFDTGNIIVDALLDDKNEKANQYNTHIEFSGFVPTMGITNADLCTIISNAVDNAIEACAKDEENSEKTINIESDFRCGYFFFRVVNPMFEKVEIKSRGRIESSKKDKSLHGYGLANIMKTADKYSGKADISAENSVFTLYIELMLDQSRK